MAQAAERVPIRSYRGVIDSVERRIFRIDRWRIPKPDGLSVRAVVYTIATFIAVLLVGRLPVVGQILGLMPTSVRLVALPILGGWGLSSWAPDGRAPHHALISAVRYFRLPKHLAGLRPCPALGTQLAPVAGVSIAAGVDESTYRPGSVKGPAVLTLRYPAEVTVEGRGGELATAKRLRISAPEGRVRPMPQGHVLEIPAGKEVRFS